MVESRIQSKKRMWCAWVSGSNLHQRHYQHHTTPQSQHFTTRWRVMCVFLQCFETNITEKNLVDHGDSLQLSSRVPTQRSPLSTHKSNTDPPNLTSENPAQPSYNPTNTVRPNKKMRDAVSSVSSSYWLIHNQSCVFSSSVFVRSRRIVHMVGRYICV